jgi:hypothetical protein
MSRRAHARGMNEQPTHIDVESLIAEIQRYLAAVDAFRAAGCRVAWLREPRMSVA